MLKSLSRRWCLLNVPNVNVSDPYAMYGLKVIGGKMTDDGKLGAFVTEIRKGGPADRQAQLQTGIN